MQRRLNREGTIRERPDGRFEVKIQIGEKDGKNIVKSFYGKTKREAKKKLDDYLSLRNAGAEQNLMTLDSYIANWLESVKVHELKPRSYDTLESTVNTHIIERIGFYAVNDLTSDIIQKELINPIIKSGASYSTVKKTYDALNACLKFAAANRVILYNPMQTVAKPSQKHYATKEIEIFTDGETEALYKESIVYGRYGNAIILMLYTGMRLAEATGLKWADYNEKERTLTIRGSLVLTVDRSRKKENQPGYKLLKQDTTKTKKGTRKIYLGIKAVAAITELHKQNYRGNEDDFIICTENYTPVRPRNMQRAFDGVLSRAQIPHKGMHSLRHTFASMLIRKGVDIKIVSELLGHSDVAFTYNRYVHIIDEQKSAAIQKLDEI